jgi:hypothetical protein
MKKTFRGVVGMALPALLFLAGTAISADAPPAGDSRVARGKYLTTILACGDCHTPMKMGPKGPEPDAAKLMAGHPQELKMPAAPSPAGPWIWSGAATNTAFAGPWGVTYAINLTSDRKTGIGVWTEEMFVRAMRSGKHVGSSREIQPPMPWQAYGQATDEDLKALFAYLKTVPPIRNDAPKYEPPALPAR